MSTSTATRTIEGVELPAAGTWVIDPAHSSVEVVARHMMISKVRGRFATFGGRFEVGERPEDSSLEVVIDAASIQTADERRDGHLRTADFLDTEKYPEITFRSTKVEPGASGRWQVTGDLTLHGVSRPVTLDVTLEGVGEAYGGPRAVFSAEAEINREDYGLTWNVALETGGVLIGKVMKVELQIQATPEAA